MNRARAVTTLVLCLAAVWLLEACLLRKEDLTGGILTTFFYPHYGSLGQQFAAGVMPRWNPTMGSGASWFGPRAGGVIYPGNLLFALLPLGHAMAVFVFLHILIAAEGARRLSACEGRLSGVGTALAYALGGFVVSMIGNPVFLVSAAWLPWAALAGRRLASHSLAAVALAGAAVGMCFLAGEPQGALIAALAAGGFAFGAASAGARRRALALAALAVALGTAAGGLTVASSLAALPETDRALSGWGDTEFGLAPLPTLLDLCVPGFVGLHADSSGGFWGSKLGATNLWCLLTLGTLGLAAAVAGLERRGAARREGVALVLAGVLLAGVDAGSLLSLRFPSKWLVLAALGLARLVGPGLVNLARGRSPWGARVLAASATAGFGLGAIVLLSGPGLEAWLESADPERVVGHQALLTLGGALVRAGVVGALGWALVTRGRHTPRRLRAALFVGLLALDLFSATKPLVRTTDTGLLDTPPLARRLRQAQTRSPIPRFDARGDALTRTYRVPPATAALNPTRLEVSDLFYRDVLWTNRGVLHGVRATSPFETVAPRALGILRRCAAYPRLSLPDRAALLGSELLLIDKSEYDALAPADRAKLEPLAPVSPSVPQIALVRNLACPPWVELANPGELADSLESAAAAVCRASDARGVVLGPETTPCPTGDGQAGSVQVVTYTPELLVFDVDCPGPTLLVVRDTFSTDWIASLDGSPALIARADLLFRAVAVPLGAHRIVFRYAPTWWQGALLATVIGWAALALCVGLDLLRASADRAR